MKVPNSIGANTAATMKKTKETAEKRSLGLFTAVSLSVLSLWLGACAPSPQGKLSIDNSVLDITKDTPFYIINGQEVQPAKDPFSYSIVGLYDAESKGLCTGSIIDKNYIVTAAHCMPRTDPRNMYIVFGTNFDQAFKQKTYIRAADGITNENYLMMMAKISAILSNPKRNKNSPVSFPSKNHADIALLKIDVPLPPNYRPIPVADVSAAQPGQDTLLAGFGTNDGVKRTGSGVLRKTVVKFANPTYSETEVSLDQRAGTGACHGDSGGPAYVFANNTYLLWGVTSRGLRDRNDDCANFSVYTKVTAFRDWIGQAQRILATRVLPPPTTIQQPQVMAANGGNQPAAPHDQQISIDGF